VRLSNPEGLIASINVALIAQITLRIAICVALKTDVPAVANTSRKSQQTHAPSSELMNTLIDPSRLRVALRMVYLCLPYFVPMIGAIPSPKYIAVKPRAGMTKNGMRFGKKVNVATNKLIEIA